MLHKSRLQFNDAGTPVFGCSQFHSGFNSYTTRLLYILQQLTGIAIKSENFELEYLRL